MCLIRSLAQQAGWLSYQDTHLSSIPDCVERFTLHLHWVGEAFQRAPFVHFLFFMSFKRNLQQGSCHWGETSRMEEDNSQALIYFSKSFAPSPRHEGIVILF